MALIKCRECGKDVSSEADKCMHCGRETKYKQNWDIWSFVIAVIILYFLVKWGWNWIDSYFADLS